jgi:hypothetical protein
VNGAGVKKYDIPFKSCGDSTGSLPRDAFIDPVFMGLKGRLLTPKLGYRVPDKNNIVRER